MAGTLVVGAEGVILVKDEQSYGASRPLTEGLELVMQLMHHPTTRTVVVVGETDTEGIGHFLKIHGLGRAGSKAINVEDKNIDPALAQWYVINRIRAQGPIGLVLTAYPEVYNKCVISHQPCLLFGRKGALGAPEQRASWNELHERVLKRLNAEAESQYPDESDVIPAPAADEGWYLSPHDKHQYK